VLLIADKHRGYHVATLLLGVAASSPVGATGASGILATVITSAATIGGTILDNDLFGGASQSIQRQRLNSLQVLSSAEGPAILIISGHARVSGQVIWATKLTGNVITTTQKQGGGKDGGRRSSTTTTTE
jgi:hypothetical protein